MVKGTLSTPTIAVGFIFLITAGVLYYIYIGIPQDGVHNSDLLWFKDKYQSGIWIALFFIVMGIFIRQFESLADIGIEKGKEFAKTPEGKEIVEGMKQKAIADIKKEMGLHDDDPLNLRRK